MTVGNSHKILLQEILDLIRTRMSKDSQLLSPFLSSLYQVVCHLHFSVGLTY